MTTHDVGSRDYYEVLGVPRDATPAQIKDAFRELALRYHPDRCAEPDAEERFKEIAAAYAVLSDPDRRATYDRGAFVGVTPEDLFGGIDLEDLFRDLGFGFDLSGGPFDRIFGRRRRRGPRPGADIQTSITITLEEVAAGASRTVGLSRQVTCPTCTGTGAASGTTPRRCEHCDGSGRVTTERRERGTLLLRHTTTCPHCQGHGTIIEVPCGDCAGKGVQTISEDLDITVPVGVESGTALRLAGHGEPSLDPGGPSGDAYLIVHVAADPRFERRGPHLWHAETIDVTGAVLGSSITVPTLEGSVRMNVPPGTQPGSLLRLANKGLPRSDGKGRGDLYVTVDVRIPTALDDEQTRLYEALRAHQVR